MEERNKSIKKKEVNLPDNPSARNKMLEECQCNLKEAYPHCKKRMRDGTCLDKLIEYYYEE